MYGDGSELLENNLPTPHHYKRNNSRSYNVAWLIDGYFHTNKGIEYLNDIVARITLTVPINQRLYYSPINPPKDITPYKLQAFQNAISLKTQFIKQAIKHENELSKDKVFWAIKFQAESLIRQFNGWFEYEILEAWANNIFEVGQDVKDRSTLKAKCRSIYAWYETKEFQIGRRRSNKTKEEIKMNRSEHMKLVNEKRKLENKEKVLMAASSLTVKKKNGSISIAAVAEQTELDRRTAKKYLEELGII